MTPPAAPPDGSREDEPRRFARYEGRRPLQEENETDPDDETVFSGLRTLQAWEVGLFLAAVIASLLVWLIFIWVHRLSPSG